jgi:hypothetical protein
MNCLPGELYEVCHSELTVRLWKGQWDDKDWNGYLGDLSPGESFLVVRHATYDDTWVLSKLGIGVIEGVSQLLHKGVIRLSRAHEGSDATP